MAIETHETYVPDSDSTTLDIVCEPECERASEAQLVVACDRDMRDYFLFYMSFGDEESGLEVSMNVPVDEARRVAEWVLSHCDPSCRTA